jgi:hypothetical protein
MLWEGRQIARALEYRQEETLGQKVTADELDLAE